MATNSTNTSIGLSKIGEGAPRPLPNDAEIVVNEASGHSGSGAGVGLPGHDGGVSPTEARAKLGIKTAKELEREQKKAEKKAKFNQKKAKAAEAAQTVPAADENAKNNKKSQARKAEDDPMPEYVEETPTGEKKRLRSLDDPQMKAYNPVAVESAWYEWWENAGFFEPQFKEDGKVKDEGYFVIVIPPPNITGPLHMGHSLGNSLQDVMIRWNRMHGKTTLWLPGCDHSSISTQAVVENMLWRRQGKTRHDLGRKKFLETVWEWKEEYHQQINKAERKLGGSTDWTREAFTMDENLSAAVIETFVKLHEEGIIYRANRLVNWCTKLNTGISNLEVDNKELKGRTLLEVPGYEKKVEFGIMVHFKYAIENTDETIEVATTRPETMLGDTGIAVHPQDERHKHLVGKKAIHPFIKDRLLPIVADDYVDMEFGTGAVKITPAHDLNDFAIGKRHKLEFINILTDDGLMNENAGSYAGQKRFDVRYTIQDDLEKAGLFVDKKDHTMQVPLCKKTKDVIEPIMKPQWWMKMESLAAPAIQAVKDGRIKILPESAEKSYHRWMEGIQDWCLSRQLWWGHRCPVYLAQMEGEAVDDSEKALWFSGRTKEEAQAKAESALRGKSFTLHQDEDVLDTWFSAGLWPFSTLGWPKKTHDLERLYPTSVLETGWDILFFWIARMIMLGLKMVGDIPFREVYCHSLVRDSEGTKMSKSLGNVIDPLDVIKGIPLEGLHEKLLGGNLHPDEVARAKQYQKSAFPDGIPQCGADALRFTMVNYATGSGDINFDIKVMHAHRKFCNKIYQATKYVLGKLGADYVPQATAKPTGKESLAEKWILHKLNECAKAINEAIPAREFHASTQAIYQYWLHQLCDVYIENSKAIIQDGAEEEKRSAVDTLYTSLDSALKMMHPFMPFITEELWQRLPRRPGDETQSIMLARFPVYEPELDDAAAEEAYELVMECSRGIRSLLAEYALKDEAKVFIQTKNEYTHKTATEQMQAIRSLSGKSVTRIQVLGGSDDRPAGCFPYPVSTLHGEATVLVYIRGRVDYDKEMTRARDKLEKHGAAMAKLRKVISAPGYQQKVEASLWEKNVKKMSILESEAHGFENAIKQFEELKLE